LSRQVIVQTAIAVVDRAGPDGLTMRALAREFDVVPMALYRYVLGREDLLEAVVDTLLEDIHGLEARSGAAAAYDLGNEEAQA